MDLNLYRCPNCCSTSWNAFSTLWECQSCGTSYPCKNGVPKLYKEANLSKQDAHLRDRFYNGFVGHYYQFIMPFLTLPARPMRLSWRHWIAYAGVVIFLSSILYYIIQRIFWLREGGFTLSDILITIISAMIMLFFLCHKYIFYLLVLAIPVRISLSWKIFTPDDEFSAAHVGLIKNLAERIDRLRVLDIATGTCNSLYRHGWMQLNADFIGVDLSEVMLLQGQNLMAERGLRVDFTFADAATLPLISDAFDVVLNYGALNGFADPSAALREMVRVAKPGGLIVFLDEQLYPGANFIERLYFTKVLSSHNSIHRCPIELFPPEIKNAKVIQIYQFYYLCFAYKLDS